MRPWREREWPIAAWLLWKGHLMEEDPVWADGTWQFTFPSPGPDLARDREEYLSSEYKEVTDIYKLHIFPKTRKKP